ncbi:MAG: signal peptidase II, partial [Gammaproteobacteria bacterium]|nr:signal peptidase II [Gammaproteobacteria bacterium]
LGSYLINQNLPQGDSIVVLPFLHFTHLRNLGGVFGLAQGQGWIFAVFSILLISALVAYLWRSTQVRTYEFLCFGFVAGGGVSNVLDRLVYGSVIDFINVQGIPYWNYIFNTADTFIHIGLWPMLFIALFLHRD